MHVLFFSLWTPFDRSWGRLTSLGATIFQDNRNDDICPEKTARTALKKPHEQLCIELSPSYYPRLECCLAPSQRSSPQAICTVSCPSSMLYRISLRSFPQAICTVSCPSSMLYRIFQRSSPQTISCPSSMLHRSLQAKLPPSYFHSFVSVQHAVSLPPGEAFRKLFARFRARPACCIAPSLRSFPQAISTVWCPSSMLYRFLPAKLSAGYFHGLVSVQHAVSHLPAKLSASYFHGFVSVQHAVPRERFIGKNQ